MRPSRRSNAANRLAAPLCHAASHRNSTLCYSAPGWAAHNAAPCPVTPNAPPCEGEALPAR
ncbi:hypothetical protein GCM10027018_28930 [Paenibacillus thermoaerophilus]